MLRNFFEDSFSLALTPDVPGGPPCSCFSLPHIISEASAFVAGLARAVKVYKKIKITFDTAYGVNTLQQDQDYEAGKGWKRAKE